MQEKNSVSFKIGSAKARSKPKRKLFEQNWSEQKLQQKTPEL
jgi:hypothetical protein